MGAKEKDSIGAGHIPLLISEFRKTSQLVSNSVPTATHGGYSIGIMDAGETLTCQNLMTTHSYLSAGVWELSKGRMYCTHPVGEGYWCDTNKRFTTLYIPWIRYSLFIGNFLFLRSLWSPVAAFVFVIGQTCPGCMPAEVVTAAWQLESRREPR